MDKIVIWGIGKQGKNAYYYYKDMCDVVCFVDNDKRKWGILYEGIEVCSPDILKGANLQVVIAVKNGKEQIIEQVRSQYKYKSVIIFQAHDQVYSSNVKEEKKEIDEDTIIISFSGGLGNQMFQYALMMNYIQQGKRVLANLNDYCRPGKAEFELDKVFKNLSLERCNDRDIEVLIQKNINSMRNGKKFLLYSESAECCKVKKVEMGLLDITGGVIKGWHQNSIFAKLVEREVRNVFQFRDNSDKGLLRMAEIIKNECMVGVHVRRGDYLLEENKWLYGDICTMDYYTMAIKKMKQFKKNCSFVFFSNDIEWVKQNFEMKNSIYVERSLFEKYQDWYDMYLMSLCKYNIIANSTFSWWAAWLNSNENKQVIAPLKWNNRCVYEDIYPEGWITI